MGHEMHDISDRLSYWLHGDENTSYISFSFFHADQNRKQQPWYNLDFPLLISCIYIKACTYANVEQTE